MRHTILTLDRWLTSLAWTLACLLLAAISALGMWQVVARFVLSQPSTWTEESMRRLLIRPRLYASRTILSMTRGS